MAKVKVSDDNKVSNKAEYKIQTVYSLVPVGNTTRTIPFLHTDAVDLLLSDGFIPVGSPVPHPVERNALVQAFFKAKEA